MIDLIVAGGGPVGLASALLAKRAGLRVVILEPRTGPIDKACGEGLMPGALAALAGLGIDPPGLDFRGIRYTNGRHTVDAAFPAGPGRGVRRTTLHAAMSAAVDAAGIERRAVAVEHVSQTASQVRVNDLTARYLAAADGLHSPVARMLGLAIPARATRRWGLRQHFPVAPWTDLVEVSWAADAEAYVTPVAEDLVGVAILSSRRGRFDDHLRSFPTLRDRLHDGLGTLGAGPLRHRTTRRTDGRVLLVGDAAGYVDALTGEGIAVGLASASALIRAVAADRPGDYEQGWRRATRTYRALTHGLLFAAQHRPLRRAVVPVSATVPHLFRAVVGRLGSG